MDHKTCRFVHVAVVTVLAAAFGGCTTVPPGYVGIVVNQWGTDKGVSKDSLVTGRQTYNPLSTSILTYPTFVQNVVWSASVAEGKPVDESISFTIKNGMQINVNISLAYKLDREKVPEFYAQFRSDDIEHFTHGFMRNVARDCFNEAAGKYELEQVMGDNGPFVHEVWDQLKLRVEKYGVIIEQFGIIGAPSPPPAVLAGINAKVQAQQLSLQKQNEIVQAQAEAQKMIAKADGEAKSRLLEAEGKAKANERLAASLTQNIIEWRKMELQEAAIAKWQGGVPQVSGSGTIPFINIPMDTKK